MRLIVFSKMFAGAMKTGFYRSDAGTKGFGDFGVAASLLDKSQKDSVLRSKLTEGVTKGIELFGTHRTGRFGDVLMLRRKGEKDPAKFLPAKVIDAGVASEAEEPGFELLRRLEPDEGADHLDEDELREIFHRVAPANNRINESSHTVLIRDDEVALRVSCAALSAAYEVDQLGRRSWFHAVGIAISRPDAGAKAKMQLFDGAREGLRQHFPKPCIKIAP